MSGFYPSVHGVQGLCEGLPHAGGLAPTSHTGSRRGHWVLPRGWTGSRRGLLQLPREVSRLSWLWGCEGHRLSRDELLSAGAAAGVLAA